MDEERKEYTCSDCGFHCDGKVEPCDPVCCINPETIFRPGSHPACEKIRLKSS